MLRLRFCMRALLLLSLLPFLTGAPAKRSNIVKFVKEHFPNKISKLESILERYEGKEDKLMKKLLRERLHLVVSTHYSKYKPQGVDQVESIVEANIGKENELIMNLDRKQKNIMKWKKKIQAAYTALGLSTQVVDAGIDQLMQAHYGKESKLLKKIQQESLQYGKSLLSGGNNSNSSVDDAADPPPLNSGGDVIVYGQQPGDLHADKMGIYQRQSRRVGGRPLYKLLRNTPSGIFQSSRSLRFYLFYVQSSTQWLIGPEQHIGANSGWLYVIDQATSPEFIKAQWNILDGMGRNWLPAPMVEVVPASDENKWQYLFQQEHMAEANFLLGFNTLSSVAIFLGLVWFLYFFVFPPFAKFCNQLGRLSQTLSYTFRHRNADTVAKQLEAAERRKQKKPKQAAAGGEGVRRRNKKQTKQDAEIREDTTEHKKKNKNREVTSQDVATREKVAKPSYSGGYSSYGSADRSVPGPSDEEVEQQQHAEALARLRLKQALKNEDTSEATLWMNLVQNGTTQQILDQLSSKKL